MKAFMINPFKNGELVEDKKKIEVDVPEFSGDFAVCVNFNDGECLSKNITKDGFKTFNIAFEYSQKNGGYVVEKII